MKIILALAISVLGVSTHVSAQTCTILVTDKPFKIKLARTISSATARVSDYVEFNTLEDIYSVKQDGCPAVLIPKETSIFGHVTRRKHRHFPFKKGELEIQLLPLKIWDGSEIPLTIRRYQPGGGTNPSQPCKGHPPNCIGGRKNVPVAPLVEATAAGGTAVVAGVADSATTRVIAASGLFTLLSQSGIGEILNGTDAQLEEGEVFDMVMTEGKQMRPAPKD